MAMDDARLTEIEQMPVSGPSGTKGATRALLELVHEVRRQRQEATGLAVRIGQLRSAVRGMAVQANLDAAAYLKTDDDVNLRLEAV